MSLEDIAIQIVIVVGMLFLGSIVYCSYVAESTAETIVMHDGNQSYACEVNRINKTPHDCKPIVMSTGA